VTFIRRTATILFALLAGSLAGAMPAVAQASGPHITVSPAAGPPGTSVTVTGSGFCASGCTPVTILLNGNVAQSNVAVSADGSFSVTAKVGGGAGTVDVLAMQTKSTETIQAITYFEMTPNVPASPLPKTSAPTAAPSPVSPDTAAPTNATTQPTLGGGSATASAVAQAGASHSDGGPSALVLALASLGGVLVLGAGAFGARRIARRRAAG